MATNGLLIDYYFCTGCHVCEVACSAEHDIPIGQMGIKVMEVGPWQISEDKWQLNYVPIPTELCNLCEERVALGKLPTCVHHCQADVMRYGSIEELTEEMQGASHQVLFVPR